MIPLDIKIDFQRAALDIKRAGMALETASQRIGRHRSWLGHVVRGEVTRIEFHEGLALIALHKRLCSDEAHKNLLEKKQ